MEKRGGHLHVGGGAAGKADDAGAGHGDQGGVEVPAGAESSHVQVDQGRHDEGEAGGGQARAPVVHSEFLEHKHGAPVVEGRFLEPGVTVEVGSDTGAESPFEGMRRVESVQHLMSDLGIARLVRAHQAQPVSAQDRSQSIEKKEEGEDEKDRGLAYGGPVGQPCTRCLGRNRSGWFQESLHFQRFSNRREAIPIQSDVPAVAGESDILNLA